MIEEKKFVTRVTSKDIFLSLKQIYGERFLKYRQDWEKSTKGDYIPSFPLGLNYELIDVCNLRCSHCFRPKVTESYKRLGFELFKKTIDEGGEFGLPSIKLGFSEPFMEKEIFEMINYAHSKGVMDIIVTTNGTLLTEPIIEKILCSKITFLRISVDANTEETYRKIRIGKTPSKNLSLSELEYKINLLLEYRSRLEYGNKPMIRLSFVVMDSNKDEIEPFKLKWQDKVDLIDFQKLIKLDDIFNRSPNEIRDDSVCPYPFQMMAIMASGEIIACCNWYGRRLILGNIRDITIKEAWDSLSMNKLRMNFKNRIYTNECAFCVKNRR